MNAVLQQYICKLNAYTIYDPEGMALLGQGSQEHFFIIILMMLIKERIAPIIL